MCRPNTAKFPDRKRRKGPLTVTVLFVLLFLHCLLPAQTLLKGCVYENDSVSPMPFVFVISKSTGNGTVSDDKGNFSLLVQRNDSLLFTFVGFAKLKVPVADLLSSSTSPVKVFLTRMPVSLNMVTVTSFKIKPYEREYMKDIVDRNQRSVLGSINSPFTALYLQYSREGRQVRKLAQIFEDLMIEEQVQQKINPEILRRLTGDEKIDYTAFRKYCFQLSNDYILSHDGFDLYTKVMDCYRRYKSEGR